MDLRDNKVAEALFGAGDPDVQTNDDDDDNSGGWFFSGRGDSDGPDYENPPKDDLRKYWRQYESNPLVREGVDMHANDIIEPGYSVKADDEELEAELQNWLNESGIVNGESGKDFLSILEAALKQREVRGTALVEVVRPEDSPDDVWGFNIINVETVSAVEYDERAMLFQSDDTDHEHAVLTKYDEAAAYIQYSDEAYAADAFEDREEVPLSQRDVIKLTLDGDAYDIFGTSRIETISDDIETLNKITEDNREAIASKGHPHWVFKVGDPDAEMDAAGRVAGLWPEEKLKNLRNEHKEDNFSAGQKDFVPGDVGVDVVHGETADIKPTVKHHTEEIIAGLAPPKYLLGHADAVNRDITSEQGENYRGQIQKARRELEAEFRPVLKRKAEALGYEGEELLDSIELRIEEDTDESPLKNEDFDAQDFKAMAEGIKTLQDSETVTDREVRQNILGLSPEPDEQDTTQSDDSPDDADSDSSEDVNTGGEEQADDDVDDSNEVDNA